MSKTQRAATHGVNGRRRRRRRRQDPGTSAVQNIGTVIWCFVAVIVAGAVALSFMGGFALPRGGRRVLERFAGTDNTNADVSGNGTLTYTSSALPNTGVAGNESAQRMKDTHAQISHAASAGSANAAYDKDR